MTTTPSFNEQLKTRIEQARAAQPEPAEKAAAKSEQISTEQAKARELGQDVAAALRQGEVPSIPLYQSRDDRFYHDIGRVWPLYVERHTSTGTSGRVVPVERLILISSTGDIHTGTGNPSDAYPRIAKGKKYRPSAKAHGAFDLDTLPPDEAIGLMQSDDFGNHVAELVVSGNHLTDYIDTVRAAERQQKLDDIVADLRLDVAASAASARALARGIDEQRFDSVALSLGDQAKAEISGTGREDFEQAVRKALTALGRQHPDCILDLGTTRDSDDSPIYYVTAQAKPQASAMPATRPIATPEQRQMLHDLRTEADASLARISNNTREHRKPTLEEHIEKAIPIVEEYFSSGIRKAWRKNGKADITLSARVINNVAKATGITETREAIAITARAIQQLSSRHVGWHVTTSPTDSTVEVTFTLIGNHSSASGH